MDRIIELRSWGKPPNKRSQPFKPKLHAEFNCVHLPIINDIQSILYLYSK